MRHRRRAPQGGHDLEVTPFINLMVVLVTFFLGSAAFFSSSVLELNIPPSVAGGAPAESIQLEIIIRKDSLDVTDRKGGLIQRVANHNGGYDYKGLNEIMKQLKVRLPTKMDATVLAEPDTSYQVLVSTMDAVRTFTVVSAGSVRYGELFPNVSLGDAPGGQ